MGCRGQNFPKSHHCVTGEKKKKRDAEVCRLKIREGMRLGALQAEAEGVLGSQAQVSGLYLRGHCSECPSNLSAASIRQNQRCCRNSERNRIMTSLWPKAVIMTHIELDSLHLKAPTFARSYDSPSQ